MSPVDQGGCCLAMYSGNPSFPSKTEHIMSRYRPIAPKPIAPKPEGTDPSDPQTSSSLSLDKSSSKLSEFSRSKRSRKRQADSSSISNRNSKKFSAVDRKRDGDTSRPNSVSMGRGNGSEGSSRASELAGLTPILSDTVAPVFGPGGRQRFNETADRSGLAGAGLSLPGRSPVNEDVGSYGYGENRLVKLALPGSGWNGSTHRTVQSFEKTVGSVAIEKDAAFMERAAANTPVVFERTVNGMSNHARKGGPYIGGFADIFKSLPVVQPQMPEMGIQALSSTPSREASGCMGEKSNCSIRGNGMPVGYQSASCGGESEVCSADDVADSRRNNLVTLSLLPDTPLHSQSVPPDSSLPSTPLSKSSQPSSTVGSTFSLSLDCKEADGNQVVADTNLTMYSKGQWPDEAYRDSKQNKGVQSFQKSEPRPLLNGFRPVATGGFVEQVSARSHSQATAYLAGGEDRDCSRGPIVDSYYLDQAYATSSDAVMLTDENKQILWSNLAFRRASSERTSGKMQLVGPHIDPLGVPTEMAVLMFQPPFHAAKCKAVLWGFLKKLIFHEARPSGFDNRVVGEWKPAQRPTQSDETRTASLDTRLPDDEVIYDGDLSLGLSSHKVNSPQPVKPVGSTICLERVMKYNQLAVPMVGTLESVQEKLQKILLPTVVTDFKHKVRWVNQAYMQMVGEPERSWLASTVGHRADVEPFSQTRLAGEVSFVCAGDQLPATAAEFSCQVRIQWSICGQQRSVVVPTDVLRLDEDGTGPMFVWQFNVLASGPVKI